MRHGSREAKPAPGAACSPDRGPRSAARRSRCRPGFRGRTTGVYGGGRVGAARACSHRAVVANAGPLGQFRARAGRRVRWQTGWCLDRLCGTRPLPTSSGSAAQGPSVRQRAPQAALVAALPHLIAATPRPPRRAYYVGTIAVARHARRRDVASTLGYHAELLAQQRGFPVIVAHTGSRHGPARRALERYGLRAIKDRPWGYVLYAKSVDIQAVNS